MRDEEAFNMLLELYKPLFFKIYGNVHRPNDSFRLDDAMQAAAIGLYHAIYYYREDQNMAFHNFVSLCSNREMKSWRRKEINSTYIDDKPILSLDYELKDADGIYFSDTISDRGTRSNVEAIVRSITGSVPDIFSSKSPQREPNPASRRRQFPGDC